MRKPESAAESAAALELLLGRLDAAVAAWERAAAARRIGSPEPAHPGRAAPREPAAVLADLGGQLRELEQQAAELRREADAETRSAADWERRAIGAIHEARDDLARTAFERHQQHREAAAALNQEMAALEAMRDAYQNAAAAIQAAAPPKR